MFEKTKQRILRKESSKPLHCIDTSVFLEMTLDTKEGKICQSHLANMGKGKYYRGVLPLSVLDAEHLVSAKRACANVFITLDKKLIYNTALEKELGIKIKPPSDFVSI
ncbi:MAG: hypothetical protein HY513_03595 [Candidatus Aenigmarchaeota archaeon]|nr:hypothetical protein [Candidatus Aenigmarchaeota archaeon]